MYRFKLKEIEVGDTDTKGGKKSTVTDVNPGNWGYYLGYKRCS